MDRQRMIVLLALITGVAAVALSLTGVLTADTLAEIVQWLVNNPDEATP